MANLEQLKAKYPSVIDTGKAKGVSWKHVHVEGEKLLIRGAAPSEAIKNEIWARSRRSTPSTPTSPST